MPRPVAEPSLLPRLLIQGLGAHEPHGSRYWGTSVHLESAGCFAAAKSILRVTRPSRTTTKGRAKRFTLMGNPTALSVDQAVRLSPGGAEAVASNEAAGNPASSRPRTPNRSPWKHTLPGRLASWWHRSGCRNRSVIRTGARAVPLPHTIRFTSGSPQRSSGTGVHSCEVAAYRAPTSFGAFVHTKKTLCCMFERHSKWKRIFGRIHTLQYICRAICRGGGRPQQRTFSALLRSLFHATSSAFPAWRNQGHALRKEQRSHWKPVIT